MGEFCVYIVGSAFSARHTTAEMRPAMGQFLLLSSQYIFLHELHHFHGLAFSLTIAVVASRIV